MFATLARSQLVTELASLAQSHKILIEQPCVGLASLDRLHNSHALFYIFADCAGTKCVFVFDQILFPA